MNSTIAAIATAPGKGAISIIRVSGPMSLEAFKLLSGQKLSPQPNVIKPYWIKNGDDKIDQSMLVYFKAPNSFSGEDMLEIHCHGSKIVQNLIMQVLNNIGIEPAKPGEFSERAYYNGKIDVSQAEAIMELVASENTNIAKLAARQLAGEFTSKIKLIRDDLTALSSAVAADLDFSEEDLPAINKASIIKSLKQTHKKLMILQASSEILPKLREGVHVALVGLPNAGKSTLLNKLLGYERSIVTEIAGTTRDTISETVEINGLSYHFTDTAGLNKTTDKVEKIGIQKTIEALESSDIILLLTEPGKSDLTKQYLIKNNLASFLENAKTIEVSTKSDLKNIKAKQSDKNVITISAKNGQGIKKLVTAITQKAEAYQIGDLQILTTRQAIILKTAEADLVAIIDNAKKMTNDIIGAELQAIIERLNELTGEQASSQIIDSIFRNFCIGK